MNDIAIASKKEYRFISFLVTAGGFLIFAALILLLYVPHRPENPDLERASYRKATRLALEAAMQKSSQGYAWLDKAAGEVRLPVERGMELALEAYCNKTPLFVPSTPILPPSNETKL